MILQLPEVLDEVELAQAASAMRGALEGREQSAHQVRTALVRHPLLQLALMPQDISAGRVRLASDEALESGDDRIDATVVVFLESAKAALCVDTGFGPVEIDAEAGSAVVLPPSSRTMATVDVWVSEYEVRSAIRDVAQREVMYDLSSTLRWLQVAGGEETEAGRRLHRAITLLHQMWA